MSTVMEELEAATHGYAGFCVGCGAMYAIAVDYPSAKRRVAAFVSQLVRDGARVERVTIERSRAELSTCKCPKREPAKSQPSLFAEGAA